MGSRSPSTTSPRRDAVLAEGLLRRENQSLLGARPGLDSRSEMNRHWSRGRDLSRRWRGVNGVERGRHEA